MKLILLTYVNRSGSTYLAHLLDQYQDVLAFPESDILVDYFLTKPGKEFTLSERIYEDLLIEFSHDYKFRAWNLKDDEFIGLKEARNHFEAFIFILKVYRDKMKPGASILLFKSERIIHLISQIPVDFFGKYNIHIMAIIRDCRAVYHSQKMTPIPESSKRMSGNPIETAIKWNSFINRVLRVPSLILIKYEDLIQDQKKIIKSIIKKLDIADVQNQIGSETLYDRLLDSHKTIHQNILKSPQLNSTVKWTDHLKPFEIHIINKYARKGLLYMNLSSIQTTNTLKFLSYEVFCIFKYSFVKGFRSVKNYFVFRVRKISST